MGCWMLSKSVGCIFKVLDGVFDAGHVVLDRVLDDI